VTFDVKASPAGLELGCIDIPEVPLGFMHERSKGDELHRARPDVDSAMVLATIRNVPNSLLACV
jgi:hypothetical protein